MRVTNSRIAGCLSSPATPTTVTLPAYRAASRATCGASAAQVGHHGAQNHNRVGRPVNVAASKGAPSMVVAVNRKLAGTVPAPTWAEEIAGDGPAGDEATAAGGAEDPAS